MKLAIVLNKIKQTERGKYFVSFTRGKNAEKGLLEERKVTLKKGISVVAMDRKCNQSTLSTG